MICGVLPELSKQPKLESNAWVLLLHYRQPVPSRNICVIAAGVVLSNLAFPPTWKCGATLYKLSLTEIILQKYVFTGFPSLEVSLLLALNHYQPLSCSQCSQIPRVSLFDSCPVGRCRLDCSVVISSLRCSIAMLQEQANILMKVATPAVLSAAQSTRQAMGSTQRLVLLSMSHPHQTSWV
jgi:hypothetical protein